MIYAEFSFFVYINIVANKYISNKCFANCCWARFSLCLIKIDDILEQDIFLILRQTFMRERTYAIILT